MSAVVDETVRLLGALRLTTDRGASARGRSVHILVDPEWDGAAQRFQVSLSCRALAVDRPGWVGLPVVLEQVEAFALTPSASAGAATPAQATAQALQPARGVAPARAALPPRLAIATRLDERGHALVHNVPPGEYRLVSGASWVQAHAPLVLPLALASADKRLTVSLRSSAPGRIDVDVTAAADAASAMTARFSFFDRADRLLVGAELGPAPSGQWQGPLDLQQVGSFTCQLVRATDRPGATI